MTNQIPNRIAQKTFMALTILVGLYAVITLAYTVKMGTTIRFPDESEYLCLASNLVATGHYTLDGSTPTAYRPPAYPLLLAAGMKFGLPITALRVANASTLLACMALLYFLLRKTSAAQARIAVLLVMAYPVLLYTAGTFYPQIPAAAFFLAAVAMLFTVANPGILRFLFAGAVLGITILMVPTFIFSLLFTAFFFAGRSQRLIGMRNAATLLVGATLILTPWIARNALTFHTFLPISTNNGISLLTGNNEQATCNAGVTAGLTRHLQATKGLSEIEADAYYRREALQFIRTHPREAFNLYLAKAANYYNFRNTLAMQSESSPTRDLIMLVSYGFLLVTAGLRIFLWRRHPLTQLERYSAYLYVLNGLFSAVFFTRIRFRLPMDILLMILASATLLVLAKYAINRRAVAQAELNPPHP